MASRRPFNPARARGGAGPKPAASAGAEVQAWSVTQVNARIKEAIFQHLPPTIVVAGEIGNYKLHSSGHIYFTLKDDRSEIACVMWRSSAGALKFKPESGMAVLATGNLDVYESRGSIQLYVRKMEPQGVGPLELAYRQMREKLEKEGLFDPAKKKPLPVVPRRIGVVTSPTGAAIRDILRTLHRRFPAADVLVYPVKVQGDGAAAEIAEAIRKIDTPGAMTEPVDVLIVGRGGGSLEDLWAFNEEVVARAIFACSIPVVSAVGHEVDVTISDLVADVRAATPTAAAEIVAPDRREVLGRIGHIQRRMDGAVGRHLEIGAARLSGVVQRRCFADPLYVVETREQRIDDLQSSMTGVLTNRLHGIARNLARWETALQKIHPRSYVAEQNQRLSRVWFEVREAMLHRLREEDRRLNKVDARLGLVNPGNRIEHFRSVLEFQESRLQRVAESQIRVLSGRLDSVAGRLRAMSHHTTLARGFTITRLKKGKAILRDSGELVPGDKIITQFHEGEIESKVTDSRQKELFD